MAESKTKPTDASVPKYLVEIGDELRRKDCETLVQIMEKATGQGPKMWGTAIVGFRDISICGTGGARKREELSLARRDA